MWSLPQIQILLYLLPQLGAAVISFDFEEPSGEVEFIKEQMKKKGSSFKTAALQQSLRQGFGAREVLREGSWKKPVREGGM